MGPDGSSTRPLANLWPVQTRATPPAKLIFSVRHALFYPRTLIHHRTTLHAKYLFRVHCSAAGSGDKINSEISYFFVPLFACAQNAIKKISNKKKIKKS
jgi:hypothetical protein